MGSLQVDLTDNTKGVTTGHIEELRKLIKGGSSLLAPGEDGFEEALVRWSAAAQKPAGAVFLPTNVSDISAVVAYASKQLLDIAVCGGAHSTAGASSTDGGLLISLSKMRKATCDPSSETITAEGGCLWEEVDDAASVHGLATVGGTVHHTGVGGLTLGGGYGWLTYKHGLVVDNLLSATVVVASGEIVTATPTENTDLFWALCGAGQNFGVTTEFVFQAYPQTDVWGGLIIHTPDKLPQVVNAWNQLAPVMSEKSLSGGLVFARPPPAQGAPMVLSVVFADTPDAARGKEAFAPLYTEAEPIMDTTSVIPYKQVNRMISPPVSGYRCSMKGVSFTSPLRHEFVAKQFEAYAAFSDPGRADKVEGADFGMLMFEFVDPKKAAQRDNAATSFANRGAHMNALVMPMWKNAADDSVSRQWARDRAVDFEAELVKSVGGRKKGANEAVMFYGNYDRESIPPPYLAPLFLLLWLT
ncbi:MAG: hypothetical protein Q9160_002131 [Pyrenula sp. 1 TL-2023]